MPDADALERRLAAVERALTDGHDDMPDLGDDAALAARMDEMEATATRLEQRVTDLDAAVQALRGYVGNVRSVNRAVERRADAALATAQRAVDDRSGTDDGPAADGPNETGVARLDRDTDRRPDAEPTDG